MQIGEVLSNAWKIIWKHKVLWIFGVLAGIGGTNTGSSLSQQTKYQEDITPQFENFANQFSDWQIALFVGILILIALFLVVLVIFLSTMGRIGLIRGTFQADRGAAKLSFGELFSGGMPYFWRVFGLNLLVGLAFALIVIIISVPLAISVIGLVCLIPMLCLLGPIGLFINLIIEQANNAMVIEGKSIMDGLRRGWEVVRDNLGLMVVLGLVLLLISWVGGFLIGIPFALILGPLVAGAIIGTDAAVGSGIGISLLCLVGYLPVLFLLNGILQGYIHSTWTLAYLRLTTRSPILEPNSSPVQ